MERFETKIIPNKRVFYNPKSYIKFLNKEKENIEQVNILPPILGKKGFGAIEVKMKTKVPYGKSVFGI